MSEEDSGDNKLHGEECDRFARRAGEIMARAAAKPTGRSRGKRK
jgi:hypothetical protein